jgi:hypothetical protein
MPGYILHTGFGLTCFHGAVGATAPQQTRVAVSAQLVAVASNVINVLPLCPFQVPVGAGTKPQPCVTVKWANQTTRVTVMGRPLLVQASPGAGAGVCQSAEQIPQGVPKVSSMQMRVIAT